MKLNNWLICLDLNVESKCSGKDIVRLVVAVQAVQAAKDVKSY